MQLTKDAFISYAHKDKDFVERVHKALKSIGNHTVWLDRDDIPPTSDWWEEIQRGIDEAPVYLFFISPNSLASPVCMLEFAHALKQNKHIVTVEYTSPRNTGYKAELITNADNGAASRQLAGRDLLLVAHENWIFLEKRQTIKCRDFPDFEKLIDKIVEAIETDLEHNRTHTRLLLKAQEWERNQYADGYLLFEDALTKAETWVKTKNEPLPTLLH